MGLFKKTTRGREPLDLEFFGALERASKEYQLRSLALNVCINMICNAVARCDFVSFANNKAVNDYESWLWNHEPNANESSTAFIHHLVYRLLADNEVLVVNGRKSAFGETLAVADSFAASDISPMRENTYTGVTSGDHTFDRTFRERDVLHLKLNHLNIAPVVKAVAESYSKLVEAAKSAYSFSNGSRLKVHVDSIASNTEGFAENFSKLLSAQVKPFFEGENTVLPEFDGYTYSDFTGGKSTLEANEIRELTEEVFDFTARAFLLPSVIMSGKVEATADAYRRFLTDCIDPICYQLQEEITRKRYGFERWKRGDYLLVDSSALIHFDMFANAANVEKLAGSGCYTINDIRRASGAPAINQPWADEFYMTKNIGTVAAMTATDR